MALAITWLLHPQGEKGVAYVPGSTVATFMGVLSFNLHKNPLSRFGIILKMRSPRMANSFVPLIKTVISRASLNHSHWNLLWYFISSPVCKCSEDTAFSSFSQTNHFTDVKSRLVSPVGLRQSDSFSLLELLEDRCYSDLFSNFLWCSFFFNHRLLDHTDVS